MASPSGGRWHWVRASAATSPIVGASANIVVANLAARDGHPITFGQFLRYGSVVVLMSLAISTAYLWLRYL